MLGDYVRSANIHQRGKTVYASVWGRRPGNEIDDLIAYLKTFEQAQLRACWELCVAPNVFFEYDLRITPQLSSLSAKLLLEVRCPDGNRRCTYATEIGKNRIPHARHWGVLAEPVGIAATKCPIVSAAI